MDALKHIRREALASSHWRITHLLNETQFELQDGQVGSVIQLRGVPFDTENITQINHYKHLKHAAIAALGEEYCLYEHIIRHRLETHLKGDFPDSFSRALDEAYQTKFQKKNFYQNSLYITLLYRGQGKLKWKKKVSIFHKIHGVEIHRLRARYRMEASERLEQAVGQLISNLKVFCPRLLGVGDQVTGVSELMSFLGGLVNGLAGLGSLRFRFPQAFPARIQPEKISEGRLSQYLFQHRLFFGEAIEFKNASGQSSYASILSLKTYPSTTNALILDALLCVDAELICTHTFVAESTEEALGKIGRHIVKMENAKDPATSQIRELISCRDDLASGKIRVGLHHHTVMVLSDSLPALWLAVRRVVSVYSEASFELIQETLGLEPAFWGQLPGNQCYLFRSARITSQNYVDFCASHNYQTGYFNQNHLGGALSLLETPSRAPLFFNFHAKGSGRPNDLTAGHTTVIGGNGSGKSVFLGFMDSQLGRYGGRSYFFDRDRGLEIYVRATGGKYLIIHPSHPRDSQFNPFSLRDSPGNRAFLKKWMKQLVRLEGELELDPSLERPLSDCVDYAYDTLSASHRTLKTVCQLLPLDFPRWDRVRQFLHANGRYSTGEYAYLFDNENDSFDPSFSRFGFDFTDLLAQSKSVLTLVCMYLMHRIQDSLDGSRVSIFFDEGWQILDNPYWRTQLKQDLPTLRKMNAHLILATQSPESILRSALSAQFLDNCATHLFFANSKANFEEHYRHFQVTRAECDFLSQSASTLRWMLYKQEQFSAICRLNLSGLENFIAVFSGNRRTVKLLEEIRAEVGDEPEIWLPIFHARRGEIS